MSGTALRVHTDRLFRGYAVIMIVMVGLAALWAFIGWLKALLGEPTFTYGSLVFVLVLIVSFAAYGIGMVWRGDFEASGGDT